MNPILIIVFAVLNIIFWTGIFYLIFKKSNDKKIANQNKEQGKNKKNKKKRK